MWVGEKSLSCDLMIISMFSDANLQCSVCWDDFKLEEDVRQLRCEHIFHEDCIIPWLELHNTCPVCRKEQEDESAGSAETAGDNSGSEPSESGSGNSAAGVSQGGPTSSSGGSSATGSGHAHYHAPPPNRHAHQAPTGSRNADHSLMEALGRYSSVFNMLGIGYADLIPSTYSYYY